MPVMSVALFVCERQVPEARRRRMVGTALVVRPSVRPERTAPTVQPLNLSTDPTHASQTPTHHRKRRPGRSRLCHFSARRHAAFGSLPVRRAALCRRVRDRPPEAEKVSLHSRSRHDATRLNGSRERLRTARRATLFPTFPLARPSITSDSPELQPILDTVKDSETPRSFRGIFQKLRGRTVQTVRPRSFRKFPPHPSTRKRAKDASSHSSEKIRRGSARSTPQRGPKHEGPEPRGSRRGRREEPRCGS